MIISTFEYVILDDVLKVDLVKYILSPPFFRNKKKSSEAEMCQAKCSPLDNTPLNGVPREDTWILVLQEKVSLL